MNCHQLWSLPQLNPDKPKAECPSLQTSHIRLLNRYVVGTMLTAETAGSIRVSTIFACILPKSLEKNHCQCVLNIFIRFFEYNDHRWL